HHANLLPWRRVARTGLLPVPASSQDLLESLEAALKADPSIRVVAVTGASNVTGEVMPLASICEIAHRLGVLVAVDAAQLAPHRPIDMLGWGVDMLTLSGHKIYAPFGAGAVVARSDLFRAGAPFQVGGGAVTLVTNTQAFFKGAPEG